MTVSGKEYHNDLIVFPDSVLSKWWRVDGHSLAIEDLKEVIDYKPNILVVGKGAAGIMRVPSLTEETLKKHKIKIISKKSGEAYKVFNEYIEKGEKVVGAFHLTC